MPKDTMVWHATYLHHKDTVAEYTQYMYHYMTKQHEPWVAIIAKPAMQFLKNLDWYEI